VFRTTPTQATSPESHPTPEPDGPVPELWHLRPSCFAYGWTIKRGSSGTWTARTPRRFDLTGSPGPTMKLRWSRFAVIVAAPAHDSAVAPDCARMAETR
jgi:hypothetical protein